jgi:error-prone DNA polymerase
VEDVGLVKIDLLGLRTLGAVSECLGWIERQGMEPPELDSLPLDDPAIYALLQRGDTIGAFQVESRAQQQMLPRLKPSRFEDMIVEVAIVRPGPIQGGAVHPYLRRRSGQEPVAYAHPSLEQVLAETLGVLLFQEQAIRVAVAAAGFTPSEADLLRRAISRSRSVEAMAEMRTLFLRKCQGQAIDEITAAEIFAQLEGFAGFGFCKSHAASFALIAYQTLHLKRYHPAAYVCALLNHQPMGFYSPEVLIGDAKRHGVAFLPPDIIHSNWGAILKQVERGKWAVRLGMGSVSGLGQAAWERIAAARAVAPFADLGDFCRRTRLPRSLVGDLIRSGPLDSLGERRMLLWQLGEVEYRDDRLEMETLTAAVSLPPLDPLEQTGWEYELLGFSPAGQLLRHYRESLRRAGVLRCADVKECQAGRRLWTAGMAVVRQRPATAKGVTFLSLEDESGLLDVVLKPQVYERCRAVLHTAPLLLVQGIVQREGRSASLLGLDVQALG